MREKTGIVCVVSDASAFVRSLAQQHHIEFDAPPDSDAEASQGQLRLVLIDGSHAACVPLQASFLLRHGWYEVFRNKLPYLLVLPTGFHTPIGLPVEPFTDHLIDRLDFDQLNRTLCRTADWYFGDSDEDQVFIARKCRALKNPGRDERGTHPARDERNGVAEDVLRDASQCEAILASDGPIRLAAPPGSGKTRVIISRIRILLNRGVSPRSILIMAFNERTRSELIERLAGMSIDVARKFTEPGVSVHTFNSFGHQILTHDLGMHFEDPSSALWDRILEEILGRTTTPQVRFAYREGLSRVRRDLIDPAKVHIEPTGLPSGTSFEEFFRLHLYQQLDRGIFGYDDQIFLSIRYLLSDRGLRCRIQDRFTHVLIDELQDLNAAQLLLTDIVSRPQWNVFAVGDDDQMIYGWRGADTRVMLGFPDRFPSTRSLTLGTNYRSGFRIIRCANRLIDHNSVRVPKSIRPRPAAPPGSVSILPGITAWDQATRMMDRILTESQEAGRSGRIAILSRFNARIPMIQTACLKAGIHFYPLRFGVFQTLSARRLRDDIENSTMKSQFSWPNGLLAHWDPLASINGTSGESTELIEQDDTREPVDAHPSIIANLVFELAVTSDSPESFLALFDTLAARERIARSGTEEAPVRIATIHSVKGREFPDVYLFNAAETSIDPEQLEEERRVFYVGVTRAIHRLIISYPIGNASRFLTEMLIARDRLGWTIDNWAEESGKVNRERSRLETRLQAMIRLRLKLAASLDGNARINVRHDLLTRIQRAESNLITWHEELERTRRSDRGRHEETARQYVRLEQHLFKLRRRFSRLESGNEFYRYIARLIDHLEVSCSDIESLIEQRAAEQLDVEICRSIACYPPSGGIECGKPLL